MFSLKGWVFALINEIDLCLVKLYYFFLLEVLSFLTKIRFDIEVYNFFEGFLSAFNFPIIQFLFERP